MNAFKQNIIILIGFIYSIFFFFSPCLAVATSGHQVRPNHLATTAPLEANLAPEALRSSKLPPHSTDLPESFNFFSWRPRINARDSVSSTSLTGVLKALLLLALLSLISKRHSRSMSKDKHGLEKENSMMSRSTNSSIYNRVRLVHGHPVHSPYTSLHEQANLRRSQSSFPIVLYDDVTRQHYSFMITVPFPDVDDTYI